MNSAAAFSYAISGSMTEQSMNQYANMLNASHQQVKALGGWLAQQAEKTMDGFNQFVNSRAWELGARMLKKNDGEYVGRFDIGYLGSMAGLQGAEGFMRNYIMANPEVMQLYLDGEISGYDGEFHESCSGVGRANPYYRKAMHGIVHFTEVDETRRAVHTHYHDTGGGQLSFRQRDNIQKTYNAINHHLAATQFDFTSVDGKKRKSFQTDEPESE